MVAKVEEGPPLAGEPPSPPDSSSEASTDSHGDDPWPSFVPEVLRINRGDVWTVAIAFGISYAVRWYTFSSTCTVVVATRVLSQGRCGASFYSFPVDVPLL